MSIQSNSLLIAVFSLLLLNYVNSQLADVDKSDEDCSSPSEFRCKSGKCIKIADICNDQNNCGIGDNSDEENCGKLHKFVVNYTSRKIT